MLKGKKYIHVWKMLGKSMPEEQFLFKQFQTVAQQLWNKRT
jgi:hypothetical protein